MIKYWPNVFQSRRFWLSYRLTVEAAAPPLKMLVSAVELSIFRPIGIVKTLIGVKLKSLIYLYSLIIRIIETITSTVRQLFHFLILGFSDLIKKKT